jgi:hypothetical protein
MIDAAPLLNGDGGLRLSPDDAAASLLVLYSPTSPKSSPSTSDGPTTANGL